MPAGGFRVLMRRDENKAWRPRRGILPVSFGACVGLCWSAKCGHGWCGGVLRDSPECTSPRATAACVRLRVSACVCVLRVCLSVCL